MSKNKPLLGPAIFLFFAILTIAIWFYVRLGTDKFNDYSTSTHSLGQLLGLVGMTLFALSFLLTTRLKFIEKWFNGLDKVYSFHHLIGAISFILILFHPVLLVIKFVPSNMKQAAIYLLPSTSWAVNFGIIALLIMILLIVLTLYINLKYQNWKLSHKLMGVVLVLAILHIFMVTTDIAYYPILKYYMFVISGIGILSYLYGSFLRLKLTSTYVYHVDSISVKDKITIITLKPKDKYLEYNPGQFIYIRFFDRSVSKEQHPFTISSAPEKGLIRLSIKSLGDYTDSLKYLSKDSYAEIQGPYGNFTCKETGLEQIWIAGGIGITPFLAIAESLVKQNKQCNKIDLYYSTKSPQEAIFLSELESISHKLKYLRVIPFYTDKEGWLTLDKIEKKSGNFVNKEFYLCGPPVMIKGIEASLENKGIKKENIHKEDFSFK